MSEALGQMGLRNKRKGRQSTEVVVLKPGCVWPFQGSGKH